MKPTAKPPAQSADVQTTMLLARLLGMRAVPHQMRAAASRPTITPPATIPPEPITALKLLNTSGMLSTQAKKNPPIARLRRVTLRRDKKCDGDFRGLFTCMTPMA